MQKYFKELKFEQIAVLLLSLLETLILLTSIGYIQKILDSMIVSDFQLVKSYLKIISVLAIVYFVLIYINQYLLRKLFFLGNFSFMKYLYSQILKKDFVSVKSESSGQILSKITNDSKKISDWYSQGKVLMIMQIVIFLVTVGYMIRYNFYVTIAMLILTFLCFLVVQYVSKKMSQYVKEDQQLLAKFNQYIIESLDSFLDVKQLKKEEYFLKGFSSIIEERIEKNKQIAKAFALYVGTSSTVAFVLPIISIMLSTYFIMKGEMTIGAAVALYTYSRMLDEPVRSISIHIGVYETSKKMEENFSDLVTYEEKIKEELENLEKLSVDINYFKHNENSAQLLENIQEEIIKGDFILLKGRSGVGKSSLLDLIMNNVEISNKTFSGSVKWNAEEVISKDAYSRILKLNQEPIIFEKSLEENILLGNESLRSRLSEVLEVSGLAELVDEKGLDFLLSKNGDNVSGGQKQRISLARILIRRPDLIILDEPTSALNKEMSTKIAKNLSEYCNKYNMTALVVSHSDDFDNYANKVIKL